MGSLFLLQGMHGSAQCQLDQSPLDSSIDHQALLSQPEDRLIDCAMEIPDHCLLGNQSSRSFVSLFCHHLSISTVMSNMSHENRLSVYNSCVVF